MSTATPNATPVPVDPSVTARLAAMMFLQFFVWGGWYVSMTGWMNEHGLSGLTAWAYTVCPIGAIISPLFLGMVADRFFASQRVLGVLHVLGGVALLAVPLVIPSVSPELPKTFWHPYVLLLLAHALCYMPTLGLSSTVALHNITNAKKQFPFIRVFGTLGWVVGNLVVGGNLKTFGLDVEWLAAGDKSPVQFYVAGGAAVVLGLFSFSLPHTPPPLLGRRVRVGELLGVDAIRLLAKPSYLVFIVCSFLVCIPLAAYYQQARNFVDFVGFSNPTLTMSFGQVSEVVFMLLMPMMFARLGVKWVLAMGMLAWVARYGLFAGAAESKVLWMTLGGVVLHGICYDFFFVAGQIYVDERTPSAIRGQAQGFLVLVTQGLGLLVGAQVVGWLVAHHTLKGTHPMGDELEWAKIWGIPAAMALAVFLVFVVLFRDKEATADAGRA